MCVQFSPSLWILFSTSYLPDLEAEAKSNSASQNWIAPLLQGWDGQLSMAMLGRKTRRRLRKRDAWKLLTLPRFRTVRSPVGLRNLAAWAAETISSRLSEQTRSSISASQNASASIKKGRF